MGKINIPIVSALDEIPKSSNKSNPIEYIPEAVVFDDNDEELENTPAPPVASDEQKELMDRAFLLLERNGNTVKSSLKKLPQTEDSLKFLETCLVLEKQGHNRKGIVNTITSLLVKH